MLYQHTRESLGKCKPSGELLFKSRLAHVCPSIDGMSVFSFPRLGEHLRREGRKKEASWRMERADVKCCLSYTHVMPVTLLKPQQLWLPACKILHKIKPVKNSNAKGVAPPPAPPPSPASYLQLKIDGCWRELFLQGCGCW